jgi:hypothetical protein
MSGEPLAVAPGASPPTLANFEMNTLRQFTDGCIDLTAGTMGM